jgi:predicted PolB exonuclease-like 3'-5' exonuclease
MDQAGRQRIPTPRQRQKEKQRQKERQKAQKKGTLKEVIEEQEFLDLDDERTITYEEFDEYDKEAVQIMDAREALGDKFPKHIYHSIICIGALVARRDNADWEVTRLGAPHIGERSEKELITGFVNRIAELSPAPGLTARPYFHRYSDDAIDLCDVLSSYSSQAKVSLHELCKVMGLPGKPTGITGADVDRYHREGRLQEIAEYCESDVLNTFRVWLRYELFRHVFAADSPYLDGDAVFGVKNALIREFTHERAGTAPDGRTMQRPWRKLTYDFGLKHTATAMPRRGAA